MSKLDWRENLRINQRRTYIIIILFFGIYLSIGFLIDVLMTMGNFVTADGYSISAQQAFKLLLNLRVFPYATVTAGIAAGIGLIVTYLFHDKLMLMGTQSHEVAAGSSDLLEQQLYNVVEELKVAAGLHFMPKIFIIEAEYMNAFASGFSEKSAMVAITQGLLEKLTRAELQAVMAHELSHIRHQDIKLTLTASVLSNLILIVLDVVFYKFLLSGGRRNQQQQLIFLVVMLLRYIMPLITMLLMMYLSRTRELMADAGCVELMRDNEPLASALIKIHQGHTQNPAQARAAYAQSAHEELRRAAYLYDPRYAGINAGQTFSNLFSTHPPLPVRLKALGVNMDERAL